MENLVYFFEELFLILEFTLNLTRYVIVNNIFVNDIYRGVKIDVRIIR